MIKFFSKRLNNKKGFTLVELLIVIAVLGILAGIAIPRMTGITDEFRLRADQQTAEAVARQVEVFVMSGKLTAPDTGTTQVTGGKTGTFGEAWPQVQLPDDKDQGFFVTIEKNSTDDGVVDIKVYYANDDESAAHATLNGGKVLADRSAVKIQ